MKGCQALASLCGRERVQHQYGRRRDQQASGRSLDRSEDDQPGLRDAGVGDQPAHQRARREPDHADHDDLAVAEDVAEPTAERDEGRGRHGIGRDQPLRPGLGEVDVPLDRRRRDGDDREIDHHHRHGRDEWPEDPVALVALRRRLHRRRQP